MICNISRVTTLFDPIGSGFNRVNAMNMMQIEVNIWFNQHDQFDHKASFEPLWFVDIKNSNF